MPAPGTSFTIVSATDSVLIDGTPIHILHQLPNGRNWEVRDTGTEVILTAN